jgi:glycosyltransferase involved in cell wall biosynthesis
MLRRALTSPISRKTRKARRAAEIDNCWRFAREFNTIPAKSVLSMNESPIKESPLVWENFVVASFARCGVDHFARVLEKHGLLAFYALGARRGAKGVPPERTRLNPMFGLVNYLASNCLSTYQGESLRFRLYPLFDRWLRSLLRPGQHLITSFALGNSSMRWAKEHGGSTFIDAENSHPQVFWDLLTGEQKKWESPYPPVAPFYIKSCLETAGISDYAFAASAFVRDSFVKQGWEPRRVLPYTLPLNLDWFKPAEIERPKSRPLTLLNTGSLCLRKGTPYLLEAFRLIRQKEPNAVLRLSRSVRDDVKSALRRYADLPIEWSPFLNLRFEDQRKKYVERFQTSDIFVFPSIEDGFAYVVAEAMACGLPVITTPNTGASDLVQSGVNGKVVPVQDPQAIADAVLKWWAKIKEGHRLQDIQKIRTALDVGTFENTIMGHLAKLGLVNI